MEKNYSNLNDYVIYLISGTIEYFYSSEQWDLVVQHDDYLIFEKLDNSKNVCAVRIIFTKHIIQIHRYNKGKK